MMRFQEEIFQKEKIKLEKLAFLLLEKENKNLLGSESLIYYQF